MFSKLRPNLTYANVMSSMAFFLALTGGTAFAVTAIDDNSVRSNHIVNGEVKNPDLGANSIGTGKVIDDSLTGNDVSGLTGVDITDGSLGGAELANLGVGTAKLASDAVTREKLGVKAVDQTAMGDNSVAGAEIVDSSVRAAEINAGAVGASEIAADAAGRSEIAPGAVGTDEQGAVPGARIRGGAATSPNTDVTRFQCRTPSFSAASFGGFDHGNMFRPESQPDKLFVPKSGVYAISGQINWADAPGKYKTVLNDDGFDVAHELTRDGDRGSVSAIAAVDAGSRLSITGCWDGFGDSRTIEAGSYLSAQWLGPLP